MAIRDYEILKKDNPAILIDPKKKIYFELPTDMDMEKCFTSVVSIFALGTGEKGTVNAYIENSVHLDKDKDHKDRFESVIMDRPKFNEENLRKDVCDTIARHFNKKAPVTEPKDDSGEK